MINNNELSLYCKEELPTWDELYNDFIKPKSFTFDPSDKQHLKLDSYWKIEKRKLILAWSCNQINKLLFEDDMKQSVLEFLHSIKMKFPNLNTMNNRNKLFTDIRFMILEGDSKDHDNISKILNKSIIHTRNEPPIIYHQKLPKTNEPSIFTTKYPRYDIDDFKKNLELIMVISDADVGYNRNSTFVLLSDTPGFKEIIDFIFKSIYEYFENGIGWKDKEGNIIESNNYNRHCKGVGYDPAL